MGRLKILALMSALAVLAVPGYLYWRAHEHERATAQQIESMRTHLARRNVTGARATFDQIEARDQGDLVVRRLRDQLLGQESLRESELERARACLRERQPKCAADRAQAALALDQGSAEALTISERARDEIQQISERTRARPDENRRPEPNVPATVPAPRANPQQAPGSKGAETKRAPAPSTASRDECQGTLAAGRRALAERRFADAARLANGLDVLGFCPGAEQLKEDVARATIAAPR
jgi:hypothetical protein